MDSWASVPELFRSAAVPLPPPWEAVFGPLRAGKADDRGRRQLGQSLDGTRRRPYWTFALHQRTAGWRICTGCAPWSMQGSSGSGRRSDDPQLTVRRVSGPHPVRVVIDPAGRLPASARLLANDGVRRIVLSASGVRPPLPQGIEIVGLLKSDGQIAPSAILAALAERGLRRILIEGGADTVSRFLAAGCLDRLHLTWPRSCSAPGRRSRAAIDRTCRSGAACHLHVHRLDDEVLFDCDLSASAGPLTKV